MKIPVESKSDRQNLPIFDRLNRSVNKRVNKKKQISILNVGYLLLLISWIESVTDTSDSQDILRVS